MVLGGIHLYPSSPESGATASRAEQKEQNGERGDDHSEEYTAEDAQAMRKKVLLAAKLMSQIDLEALQEELPAASEEEQDIYQELGEIIHTVSISPEDAQMHFDRDPEAYGNLFTKLEGGETHEALFDDFVSAVEIEDAGDAKYITLDRDHGFDLIVEPDWDPKTHEPAIRIQNDNGGERFYRYQDIGGEAGDPVESMQILLRGIIAGEVIASVNRSVKEEEM